MTRVQIQIRVMMTRNSWRRKRSCQSSWHYQKNEMVAARRMSLLVEQQRTAAKDNKLAKKRKELSKGSELMSKYGINVPKGVAVSSVDEVHKAIKDAFSGQQEVVVKSQVLAGGRGLGTFKNGFKGGVHIVRTEQVADTADLRQKLRSAMTLVSYEMRLCFTTTPLQFFKSLRMTYGASGWQIYVGRK